MLFYKEFLSVIKFYHLLLELYTSLNLTTISELLFISYRIYTVSTFSISKHSTIYSKSVNEVNNVMIYLDVLFMFSLSSQCLYATEKYICGCYEESECLWTFSQHNKQLGKMQ